VPILSYGTATFGGVGRFFNAWGTTEIAEARRLVDLCLDAGVNFFDTVLQRPSVVSVVIGARNEEQPKENLGAVGWQLDATQMACLDAASAMRPIYPYWHQRNFPMLTPSPVPVASPRT
jgi:aryl-alcohol dehydrogenase-like predicted oxidoreductase